MAPVSKKLLIALGSLIVLVLIVVAAVPLFLNADSFRTRIEEEISASLGRKVTLGKLDLSIFSGGLVAQNASIADDPAFSTEPFLTAKTLKIGVEMSPLIFDKKVNITGFTIDTPTVNLIQHADGKWNYSTIGGQKSGTGSSKTPDINIAKIAITGGTVNFAVIPAPGQPATSKHTFDQLDFEASNVTFVKEFPFKASAHLPGDGKLALDGTVGPLNQQSFSASPLKAHAVLSHLDLASSGVVDAGIKGLASADINAVSDGTNLNANISANAQDLQLAANGSPSKKPVDLQMSIAQNLDSLAGQIQKATITIGRAAVNIAGNYHAGPVTTLDLKVSGQSLPIDELEAFLPSVGVHLPTGSQLKGGTISTDLAVTGTSAAPIISGPLRLSNTSLANFDLGSKLSAITALTGSKTGSTTEIRSLSTNINVNAGNVRTDNLALDMPALGTATGAGTVSASGALNYNLILKLTGLLGNSQGSSTAGAGGVAGSLLGMIPGASGAGGLAAGALRNGVPVAIGGTTSNPTFTPNLKGVAASSATSILSNQLGGSKSGSKTDSLSNALGGLFNRKR